MFGSLPAHSVSTGNKKNLLTFSATTNACLKKEEKKKKRVKMREAEYCQLCLASFFFFWTVDNQISKNPAGDDPAEL